MKTQFSRRELYALGEPIGESATSVVAGRRIYGGGGGAFSNIETGVVRPAANTISGAFAAPSVTPATATDATPATATATTSAPFSSTAPTAQTPSNVSPMSQTDAQQGIAGYAQPYVNTMLGATMQNLFNYDQFGNATGLQQYNPYSYNPADYVAGFSPLQQQTQQGVANLQNPYQTQQATNYANQAIQGLMGAQYNPQTSGYMSVGGQQLQTPDKLGYQGVSNQNLQNFQMGPAERIGTQQFTGDQVGQYMNPYLQQSLDPQLKEIQRQYDITGQQEAGNAVKQGAFGGTRQALMQAENQRNKNTAMNQAIGQGYNTAYTNAANQFNAQQQANLQAQAANQQAGLTTGLQNLNALLGVQSLGAGQNLQAQLANQQAGLTAGQANQNMQYNTGLQNAQLAQQAQLANQSARQAAQNLAAQQQQFGANYGLQGLQSALSGANTLGGLGTQQLNNQLGIYGLQNTLGQQQQQQQQNIINQGVQNYQTAQQYPMQQLTQMKNMLSGLPITTTSTQNYQAAPTNLQNLMALGIGGYGLNQLLTGGGNTGGTSGSGSSGGITGLLNSGASGLGSLLSGGTNLLGQAGSAIGSGLSSLGNWASGLFNEGGQVKSYAKGGVTSEDNVRSIANFLPTQQLPKSLQMAQGRGDLDAAIALQQEMAERASIERGLGGAFNQLPQSAQQNVVRAAGGGIIAFEAGGPTSNTDGYPVEGTEDGATTAEAYDDNLPSKGDPRLQGLLGNELLDLVTRMKKDTGPKMMTPGEVSAAEEKEFNRMQRFAGPAPYDTLRKQLTEDEAARAGTLEQGKGLAALQAMSGMLQPGGAMRGLGAAGSAFASSYGDALKADKAEKRYIGQMQFNLADAERKERMGLTKEARASVQAAQQAQLNAYKAGVLKDQAMGNILGKGMQATRQVGGAGGAGKGPKLNEQLAAAEIAHETNPTAATLKTVTALRRAVAQTKDIGPGKLNVAQTANDVKIKAAQDAQLAILKRTPDYLEATPEQKTAMEARVRADAATRATYDADTSGTITPIKLD